MLCKLVQKSHLYLQAWHIFPAPFSEINAPPRKPKGSLNWCNMHDLLPRRALILVPTTNKVCFNWYPIPKTVRSTKTRAKQAPLPVWQINYKNVTRTTSPYMWIVVGRTKWADLWWWILFDAIDDEDDDDYDEVSFERPTTCAWETYLDSREKEGAYQLAQVQCVWVDMLLLAPRTSTKPLPTIKRKSNNSRVNCVEQK